ncbi:hypothetical protein Bca52824_066191 [Brassica carinata]|uniref:Dynamin GTPase effector domain-containing protein n=1 Tax=Brassica carinata TaxID=52824 RepID=A0A8X7UBP6_BRACI|nr:hypothetical protein Bca52824_066191 [Brassica carinata]
MKLLKDSETKAGNGFVLVDMESSYLTVELFRKLHLEPKKEKPNPRNAPSQNVDIYSDNHFRIQRSAYINMLFDSLRNSLPKTVIYYQVREAMISLNFFYTHVDRKEEKSGTMLDEDKQLMEQRGT